MPSVASPERPRLPRWTKHALAVTVLVLVGVVGYRSALFSASPLGDEYAYVCAAHAVLEHRALSDCPAYLYGPALARVGATILAQGGEVALLGLLRAAVWLGAAATLWLSLALTGFRFWVSVLIGVVATLLWPPVTQSLSLGNLSPACAALTLAALLLFERWAWLAGVLLALAILLKPLPAAVPVVLVAGALGELARSRRVQRGPLLTGLVAALLVAVVSWRAGGFPTAPVFDRVAENPITIVRTLDALGVTVSPLVIFVVVVLSGALLAAKLRWDALRLAGLAIVTSLLSSPLVWCHTWLLATPLALLAFDRAVSTHRGALPQTAERQRAVLELLLVTLAALALSVSDAFGFVAHGSPLNALFIAIPLLAPSALLFYSARRRESAQLHGRHSITK